MTTDPQHTDYDAAFIQRVRLNNQLKQTEAEMLEIVDASANYLSHQRSKSRTSNA